MVRSFLKMEASPLLDQGLLQFILPFSGSNRACKRGPFEASTSISKRAAVSVEVSGYLLWDGNIESFH